ncbi:MAG: amino acid ABC transporter substrate-binding protein [candidate division NC10 bacterium]|nr:amino acid ABC transporter substrate-binding protein [candidate division NC10 bacterium]
MAPRTEILAGVSLSLSGKFQRQGKEALNGLRLWVDYVNEAGGLPVGLSGPPRPVQLITYDDESRIERAKEHVLRLLTQDEVDLLFGPYSSGLTRAVAPLAEAHGKILWNHGGASDAIFQQGFRHLVSVLSPASDYLRALPRLIKQKDPEVRRIVILHATAGSFAAQVARGAAEGAKAARFDLIRLIPFDSPLQEPIRVLHEALKDEPELLIGVGSFDDDDAIVRERALLPGVKTLAVVAAGLEAFYEELGDPAEGIIGPSQWEPGVPLDILTGPSSSWFVSAFQTAFHHEPEYPAAQAFATGVLFAECLRLSGTLDDERLLAAAHGLETTTLFGRFQLDPVTGRQIGHQVLLIQWRSGRKVVLKSPHPPFGKEGKGDF